MSKFYAKAREDGGLEFRDDAERDKFRNFLRSNPGIRLLIDPITPESKNQRAFFEGAIVPLMCFYQEHMDYHDEEDLRRVREWIKLEYNGEYAPVDGKIHKVAKSTKGLLNKGFIERVMDGMADNGYQVEILEPEQYKVWRDTIYPNGGPENYIDYLLSTGSLRKPMVQ